MAQERKLRIAMVATEAVPFAKEGGVADVMGSLPKELAALGHEVCLFLPRYGVIDPRRFEMELTNIVHWMPLGGAYFQVRLWRATLPGSSVQVYLLENEEFFGVHRHLYLGLDQRDEQRRFILFCRALLEMLPMLGFAPDIFHLNDWQTAPCAAFLRSSHAYLLRGRRARIVYTIHNLQYQGHWDPSILEEVGLDRSRVFGPQGLEYWGDVNWMKGGINYADVITTVSRRYAEEIQTLDHGWGLDEVLFQRHSRVLGIPNGIDWESWNPAADSDLAAQFTAEDVAAGKARNRTALREEFGLPDEPDIPVIGVVSRLVDQKGFDLVADIADELGALQMQLVVLGTGHAAYERLFRELSEKTPNIRARIGFDVALSHRIYAGSDFFLMPSAFEPGGLGQLIALRYGTLPIVRATGGLADTVTDADADTRNGNGLSFSDYTPEALLDTLHRALKLYDKPRRWPTLVKRAMAYDSRWTASARAYEDLYRRVLRVPPA
jgi:starch synthase